jgi:hypothetical protein
VCCSEDAKMWSPKIAISLNSPIPWFPQTANAVSRWFGFFHDWKMDLAHFSFFFSFFFAPATHTFFAEVGGWIFRDHSFVPLIWTHLHRVCCSCFSNEECVTNT